MVTFATLALLVQQIPEEVRYSSGGLPKGWIMIVISAALYILPSLLAWKRGSRRFGRIITINLLLGWTIIGWVVSMLMTLAWEPPPDGESDTPHIPGT